MIFMKSIFEAIETKKDIKVGDRIIHITPRLTKKDFLDSLSDIGKKTEKEYFEYFGTSPIAIEMYPTIKGIKDDYNVSYKELSNIGRTDLIKRVGHNSIDTTLKYYKGNSKSKKNNQNKHKELPDYDYLEFIIYFTDNKDLYEKLKPLKEKASCSWETFRNLKWKDINLEEELIYIEEEMEK